MQEQPLVSVIINSYNREQYIAEAIESVLRSSYTNFELIIADDASTDNTVKIAKTFESKDQRISVYVNEANMGQFPNRNKAASFAKGRYIKYVDSDDRIIPSALQQMVEGMEANPGCGIGIICTNSSLADRIETMTFVVNSNDAFVWHYDNGGLLYPGPTGCIYRKETFDRINGFNDQFGMNGDVLLNLQLASLSSTILFPQTLIYWRRHEGQVFKQENDQFKLLNERYELNRQVLMDSNCPLPVKIRRRILLSLKIMLLRNAFKLLAKGKLSKFAFIFNKHKVQIFHLPLALLPIRWSRAQKLSDHKPRAWLIA